MQEEILAQMANIRKAAVRPVGHLLAPSFRRPLPKSEQRSYQYTE